MTIELVAQNRQGHEHYRAEYDTLKQARGWVKDVLLRADYWDRLAESEGYAAREVFTIQLLKNGECVQDWFPDFNPEVNSVTLGLASRKRRGLKASTPKGYRIFLNAAGHGRYDLKITKNGRQIAHPVDLRGLHEECKQEAIMICERNEMVHPDSYAH